MFRHGYEDTTLFSNTLSFILGVALFYAEIPPEIKQQILALLISFFVGFI